MANKKFLLLVYILILILPFFDSVMHGRPDFSSKTGHYNISSFIIISYHTSGCGFWPKLNNSFLLAKLCPWLNVNRFVN